MRAMASTALATTWPPRSATSRVLFADWLACCAFSALLRTVAEISSIEADVCSKLAACSSVRCERSDVLPDNSAEAFAISRVATTIEPIVSCRRVAMALKSSLIWR